MELDLICPSIFELNSSMHGSSNWFCSQVIGVSVELIGHLLVKVSCENDFKGF